MIRARTRLLCSQPSAPVVVFDAIGARCLSDLLFILLRFGCCWWNCFPITNTFMPSSSKSRRRCRRHWCWFEWNGLVVAISWHRSRHLVFSPLFHFNDHYFLNLCRISHILSTWTQQNEIQFGFGHFSFIFPPLSIFFVCVYFVRCYCCYVSRFDSTLSIGASHKLTN